MKRKSLSACLVLVMVFSLLAGMSVTALATETESAAAFTDVAEGAWYAEAVRWAADKGVMNGVGNGRFDPQGNTTRAMFVTMLWRMEGEPVVNSVLSFDDVAAESWYTEAVRWASAEKIVNGLGEKIFAPNSNVSREQIAVLLHRYMQYKGRDVSVGEDTNILSYDDALDVSEWARAAMQWACGAGLIQGKGGATLAPKADATRAEVATIFMRWNAPAEQTAAAPVPTAVEGYFGLWQDKTSQRASMIVYPAMDGGVGVGIHWAGSAFDAAEWQLHPALPEDTEPLTYRNGVKSIVTYAEDGSETTRINEYADSEGSIYFIENDTLVWIDSKEESSVNCRFQRIVWEAPSAEELTEGYFKVVAGSPEVEFNTAAAVLDVMRFAEKNNLWITDVPALRANMLKAWEGLSEEERAAFDDHFMEVVSLIHGCIGSWSENTKPFEFLGAVDVMEALLNSPVARLSWDVLEPNTFTIGNSES